MTDAAQMAALHAAAAEHETAWSAAAFAEALQNPLTVVSGDGRGFALARCVADEAELLLIAVHPDHQRRGLGRSLMQDWIAAVRGRGARLAYLEVAAPNLPAKRLYEGCGFTTTGLRRGYYPGGVDAVLMARALT